MGEFTIGQRVRTLVDAPSAWAGGWGAPSGTGGTVTYVNPATAGYGYGILLDGDPSNLSASFDAHELEPVT